MRVSELYFKCVASNICSPTTWISSGYWWLGVYFTCTTALLSWMEVAECLHISRKVAIFITQISSRNVCLSHFKIPNISNLKMQHLRAKLLRNHFIPIAKMRFILQWENTAVLVSTQKPTTKSQSHFENDKSFWYFHTLSPVNLGHLQSHRMRKKISFFQFS